MTSTFEALRNLINIRPKEAKGKYLEERCEEIEHLMEKIMKKFFVIQDLIENIYLFIYSYGYY